MLELVADYRGSMDEDDLFLGINEVIVSLKRLTDAIDKPGEKESPILSVPIPQPLLERLDRPDGQSNPSLYSLDLIQGIMLEHSRVKDVMKHLSELGKEYLDPI
jgi:hypothetical protein